jgi:hypothetical protein
LIPHYLRITSESQEKKITVFKLTHAARVALLYLAFAGMSLSATAENGVTMGVSTGCETV